MGRIVCVEVSLKHHEGYKCKWMPTSIPISLVLLLVFICLIDNENVLVSILFLSFLKKQEEIEIIFF
jgi:hypothetical protein